MPEPRRTPRPEPAVLLAASGPDASATARLRTAPAEPIRDASALGATTPADAPPPETAPAAIGVSPLRAASTGSAPHPSATPLVPLPHDAPDPQAIARAIDTMPAFPAALLRVRHVLADHDVTTNEIAASVAMDAALTVAVMRLANSARFGVASRRFSLTQSISRIGRSELRALLDSLCAQRIFDGLPEAPGQAPAVDVLGLAPSVADTAAIWRFSLQGALAARHWAAHLPDLHVDREEAFTAALFRDLGRIYTDARVVHDDRGEAPGARLTAEQDRLGFTHADLGAELVRRWNFPDTVVRAVRLHHQPPPDRPSRVWPDDTHPSLALVVQLGDHTALRIDDADAVDHPGETALAPLDAPQDPFESVREWLIPLLPAARDAWDAVTAASREDLAAYTALLPAA